MGEPHSALQRNRIHRALSRPNLLMGADRELLLVTGLVAIILIFVVLTLYSALFGIAIWFVIVGALRMMAKSDPLMRHVYVRHLRYRHHYLPTSSPWRRRRASPSARGYPSPRRRRATGRAPPRRKLPLVGAGSRYFAV